MDSCNKENHEYDPQPEFSIRQKISITDQGIIFNKVGHEIDTLFFTTNTFQLKKKVLTDPFFYIHQGMYSNGQGFENGVSFYDVKYIRDSCFSFLNQPNEEIAIFEFYPNSSISDTTKYHKPLTVFLSKKTGIPLGVEYSVYDSEMKAFFMTFQRCLYSATYRGNLKKLKRVLF